MSRDAQYEAVIGIEVHAQLQTRSKAFCGCAAAFGSAPNSSVCPVCLGMPGVLPVLNREVVDCTVKMGLATHCTIAPFSTFARKNYFYPDLPKGYQISQYEEPLCAGGHVEIELEDGTHKRVGITRIHMEEDAGKLMHDQGDDTLVDLNRCGVPLIEIVSEPDLRHAREASLTLVKIRQLVTYLGICDGNMEEGSLRCDANVSVRKKGETAFGTKTELKNMNSFRNVERAIDFEIGRQTGLLERGERVTQETLLWDAGLNAAYPMRSKEEAHDYRYFPDPDLVPVRVDRAWIARLEAALPEDPAARRDRLISEHGLPKYDADLLTSEKGYADYYERCVRELGPGGKETYKLVSNWVMTEVLRAVKERKSPIGDFPVGPARLAGMIRLLADGVISSKIAKEVFAEMLVSGDEARAIVERKGLVQLSDASVLETIVGEVLAQYPPQVEKYRSGNEKVLGFFVGEVMKRTGGKANPGVVHQLLKRRLH